MARIEDVINHEDFQKLPFSEQLKGLRMFPDFAALKPAMQVQIMENARQKAEKKRQLGFFGTLGQDIKNLAGTTIELAPELATLPLGPVAAARPGGSRLEKTTEGMAAAQHEQFEKGRQAFREGDYVTGAGRTAAGALPVVGPFAAQMGEELGEKRYGAFGAHAVEMAAPESLRFLPRAKVGPIVPSVTNPVEERALQYAESRGIPISVGQRTGRTGLQRVEQGLRNVPGAAGRTERFYRGQEEALEQESRRLATQPSPVQTSPYGAGQAIRQRLQQRITRLKGRADQLYDEVRQAAAANVKQVQTGTKTSPVLGPGGQPITTPTYAMLETPVDLAPVRANLRTVYEDLQRSLPPARQASSPAFRALQSLMESGDQFMNAMDFDRSLSAIKAITRDGESQFLTSKSQGLAKQVVQAGEREFQKALSTAGPDITKKLYNGRKLVRSYYETDELLGSLQEEPAALYHNLVTGGDRVMDTLRDLNRVAPKDVRTVGRTFLEGLTEKATREGGFTRSAGVKADWERLGPETENLLFGPQLTSDLNNFFLAAKRLTSPLNPSGTAHMGAALGAYGAVGAAGLEALRALVFGTPEEAAAIAGGTAGLIGGANLSARLLFTPGGARLMQQVMTVPYGSRAFWNATRGLNAMANDLNKTEQTTDQPK